MNLDAERAIRQAIFDALAVVVAERAYVTREELSAFPVAGEARRLVDQSRGIWNPRNLAATLSVVSSPDGPYADSELEGGLFRYDYRAGSTGGDNTKLRAASQLKLPLILLIKQRANEYVPIFPVYVVRDDEQARQFLLAVDEGLLHLADSGADSIMERKYAERIARHRLHQARFRGLIMRAYKTQCAICSLRHGRLLDAAHIIGDRDDGGEPITPNGLSLCKIHHAAYDADLLAVAPDYTVHINSALLEEVDGPMLRHGLQDMHGRVIQLPTRRSERPDAQRLERRWARFASAG